VAEGERVKRAKILWIALACVLVVLNAAYFVGVVKFKNFAIASGSMEPTLRKNDHVVVMRTKDIRRGDLVAYRSDRFEVVKRAIAIGGDTFEMHDDHVLVNGVELVEPYVYQRSERLPGTHDVTPLRVPIGTLFVLGDNRDNSNDSRYHGPVIIDDVVGRVVLIYSARGFRRPPAFSRTAPAPPPK
jgi:signal peptidase I